MINWKITNLEYYNEYQGLSNVVKTIHYIVEATDADNNIGQCVGSQQLDLTQLNAKLFTEFESITEDNVISWLKDSLNATDPSSVETLEGFALQGVVIGNTEETNVGLPSNW